MPTKVIADDSDSSNSSCLSGRCRQWPDIEFLKAGNRRFVEIDSIPEKSEGNTVLEPPVIFRKDRYEKRTWQSPPRILSGGSAAGSIVITQQAQLKIILQEHVSRDSHSDHSTAMRRVLPSSFTESKTHPRNRRATRLGSRRHCRPQRSHRRSDCAPGARRRSHLLRVRDRPRMNTR